MSLNKVFSKTDTTFFKGIGIIMIVLHNYLHIIPGFALENEAKFNSNNVFNFWNHLQAFTLIDFFGSIFGFFGHYGVQIFIVFSAYGLSIQYSKKNISSTKFMLHRLKKVYFLMFFGIAVCLLIYYFAGKNFTFYEIIKKIFLLSTTFSSFSEWYLYGMFSGPFWFFALIIQVYILFPLLYKFLNHFKKSTIWIPFLIAYILIYLIYFGLDGKHLNLLFTSVNFVTMGNIIGHLPEVFLGIAMAQFKFISFKKPILFIAFLTFIGSLFFEVLFPLSFLSISIIMIQSLYYLEGFSNLKVKQFILYIGKISMILFIVNGPLRHLVYFQIENSDIRALRIFVFLVVLLISSDLLFRLYSSITRKLRI